MRNYQVEYQGREFTGYWTMRPGCLGIVAVYLLVTLVYAVVGALFAAFSLPDGTARLTAGDGWASLRWLAGASAAVNGALPAYSLLLTCLICATGVFLLAVLALGARHREPAFAVIALLTAPLAAAGLHAVAWVGAAVHWVVRTIGPWVLAASAWVRGWDWWVWVLLVALGVLSSMAFSSNGPAFVSVLGTVGGVVVSAALSIGLGLLLLGLVFKVPFLQFLLALSVLCVFGQLVVDQLTGTVKAGRGHRGVLLGALGVGTSWSMLMVVGDVGGSHALYPQVARDWVANTLMGDNPPQFDAFMALVVVAGSALSVLANVHRMREEPTHEQFMRSVVFTLYSMAFAALIAAIGHRSETGGNRRG
ncbi:hypothetical protein [Actinokineospora sp. NBRC 105648]|uniref:hypothetical protein n=1 Tax=Actinokineospora sp. NBRC 105648 TaxID=3032206 RepID=UPI0024A2F20E|nr:hypothetical protein [Actinokineospora sp. NBRC 105648]GLZ36662.1 hypothetical protein Acsp05_02870 [Actinokineospora sp. NBRC 105648]